MRASIMAAVLIVSACANIDGTSNAPSPLLAEAPSPVIADYPIAVDAPAGAYRLDPRHTSVLFRIRHMDLSWFTARFDAKDATLELDPADPSRSRLTASVEATSVNTGIVNALGERNFDRSIGRALGAETAPQITFVSTRIERTGEHSARIVGDLTLNGQTHPATLEASFGGGAVDPLRGGNMVLGFSAHGVIHRSDWGVTQWNAFTGDDVQIVVEAEFVKA